ncbi:MAG: biotin--[acetyl-CoA-carboxylase] ligase [Candidatus Cellulosilyticum pullistercoris]|uniref:Bifunctional ligase/repressor BirA n=1 Tax=Candidatus Cellulosilyticum pullistercoris TaxID=2838521 RepID=A0A9E2KDN8_9FIRM|nr:biotin--[acetyl-CoA-carboxylase] ligase [Candidatus Cellulosilyticum pullistercoris]
MEMKDKVLAFLKEQEEYRSGEEISQKLGVTRAAIWKAIKKLQADGYEIESSTKKGYKLLSSPNVITPSEIKHNLCTEVLGQDIYYKGEIDSTNNQAKVLAREGAKEGHLIIAEHQSQGKGRLGRSWQSPAGTGIWMSLILRPHILPKYASQLTLIAGLSMCEVIQEITGLEAKIKWPNDIVVNGKKVCGILTEMSAEMESINYIILGIGVNVNMAYFPEELPYASSLAIEGKKEYSRKAIIKAFLEKFEIDYKVYKKQPDLTPIMERYEKNCITLNRKVKLLVSHEEVIAKATGISNEGELLVTLEDGTMKVVSSGEVSVRGLYDYV